MNIAVNLSGPLFKKKIDAVVKAAIIEEALEKIGQRMERGGKGLGARRNIVSRRTAGLEMEVDTTKRRPRTKGTAWARKNMGIVRGMAPHVLRKTALRIIGDLS